MEHYSVQMVAGYLWGIFFFFWKHLWLKINIFITPNRYIRGLWSHREEAGVLLRTST